MKANQPPESEAELFMRAQQLTSCRVGELAEHLNRPVPLNSTHAKGWLGQLIEDFLGADSGSLSQPDFNHLGIELKTLPLHPDGRPKESTYICTAPLHDTNLNWRSSPVYKKMAKILWIPYFEASTIEARRIGAPLLWSMDAATESILKQDWLELTEMIHLGHFDQLSAHMGQYLQIRPKAMNSKNFVNVINHEGQEISIVPKGFYLRPLMTKQLLACYFKPPALKQKT